MGGNERAKSQQAQNVFVMVNIAYFIVKKFDV
jgi:hypothetical protein